jgi:hypothetical protein
MYVAGQIAHPVTVDIRLNPNWKSVGSGLEPVSADQPAVLNIQLDRDVPVPRAAQINGEWKVLGQLMPAN